MATELVNLATNEKLAEIDWSKNIEICEIVARDRRQAKDVVKAIKKRLGSKDPTAQLYAVMLLEMLMNNIGEPVHEQVIDAGVLPVLVKIVKKKTDLPVRERIFLLLDATQTSVGGAKGKFPQYYSAYYDLVSAGVQFPQRPREAPPKNTNHQTSREAPPKNTNHQTSQVNKKTTLNGELAAARKEVVTQKAEPQTVPESSIIQKATNALEVLKEVLDAVDPQNPEGARDEFTLDLVEQCSFQKQRVMHLVISSRDENLVSRAIELNEQLQKILTRHDDLLSGRPTLSERSTLSDRTTSSGNQFNHIEMEDEDDEEEAEQLFRRLRKGKACAKSEDEQDPDERVRLGLLASSIQGDRLNRPLIRSVDENSREAISHPAAVVIPPPPSKHAEREKFFQEKKVDGAAISGHMRGLSLHSRNGSSCRSESTDYSE